MMTQPSGDWSVFQQIFAEHWDEFQRAHPRYQTSYYDGLVAKMLACGNPEKMGYVEYRCLQCGQGTHRVAMSCKSSLCLRCAKVHVDNWVSQVSTMLHEGVISRHIILTVPAMFRTTFYQNAAVVLSALMRCGVQCLDDFYSAVRGKALRGGSITVLHTHGRKGQWHLLSMLRKTLETDAINQLVDACFRKYPNGLVTNVQKGKVPSQYQSLARYVAQYVVSPPISVRRIDRYDGERATKTFAKVKVAMQAALAKVEGVVKGAVKIIARLTYRQRYEQSTGRDPLRCPHCQSTIDLWRIRQPTYGVLYVRRASAL